MVELKINEEFRSKIPPLTEAEFEQLRENILSDGEVYEPIVTWNGTIVDGHNRWRIIQEHPEIPYKVKEMEFTDKWAAFDWMYRKQLGRRNLTDEQRTYLLGKLYESRKKSIGGNGSNQYTKREEQIAQNGQVAKTDKEGHGVSGEIAMELNIGRNTVRRAEHFAKGIDALREVSPEAADKIINGKANVTKSAVAELKAAPKEEVKEFAKAVNEGKPIKAKPPRPMSPQMKDFAQKMISVVDEMKDLTKERKYTLDDAICDLNSAEDVFLNQVEFVLNEHKDIIAEDECGATQVIGFIETVISDLNELKGMYI